MTDRASTLLALALVLLIAAGCPQQTGDSGDSATSDTGRTADATESSPGRETGSGDSPYVPAVERLFEAGDNAYLGEETTQAVILTNLGATDGRRGIPDLQRLLEEDAVEINEVFTSPGGMDPAGFPNVSGQRTVDMLEERGITVSPIDDNDLFTGRDSWINADLVLLDLPPVRSREHTNAELAFRLLEAARESGKRVLIIDHPVPGVRRTRGPVPAARYQVDGALPFPLAVGLTFGELATEVADRKGWKLDFEVVTPANYGVKRGWSEHGLKYFSPDGRLTTRAGILNYPGLVLFEGTNLALGRGKEGLHYRAISAPWLDPVAVRKRISDRIGYGFETHGYTARGGPYQGEEVSALEIVPPDEPGLYSPYLAALKLLAAVQHVHPEEVEFRDRLDRLFGREWLTDALREGRSAGQITGRYRDGELDRWQQLTEQGGLLEYQGEGGFNRGPDGYYNDWTHPYDRQ